MRRSGWGRDACHRSLRKVIVRALWEPLCSRDVPARSNGLYFGRMVSQRPRLLRPLHTATNSHLFEDYNSYNCCPNARWYALRGPRTFCSQPSAGLLWKASGNEMRIRVMGRKHWPRMLENSSSVQQYHLGVHRTECYDAGR
jgi:hypothetical protein